MSYSIKIEHDPNASMESLRYIASMYKDNEYVGPVGYGATRKDAALDCADRFEAARNSEPDEWITYTPAA